MLRMIERWLVVLLLAFVPLVVAFFLPRGLRLYCLIAAAVLIALAIADVIRQETRKPRSK